MKKILFISHEASLSGAPYVLLYFMEWLSINHLDKYEISILHLKGGELESKFNSFSKYNYKSATQTKNIFVKIINKISNVLIKKEIFDNEKKIVSKLSKIKYDLIYANTAATLNIGCKIKEQSNFNTKLIAHIHELFIILNHYVKNPEYIKSNVDWFITASGIVQTNLQEQWKVNSSKISTVYEFSKITTKRNTNKNINKKFTIGASGNVCWRKGHNLFIQVARYLKSNYMNLDLDFIWVGDVPINDRIIIEADLKKLDLLNEVKFVGIQEHPHLFFENFDVFLMTSREDPFPLVCIEVGMMGIPIICFDKATGTQEVINNGGGKIVPYLNIEKMSEAILEYYENREELLKDSQKVKEIFKEFVPNKKCPEIYTIIKNIIQ